MPGIGHVPGGEDPGHARLEELVGDDAVLNGEPGVLAERHPRDHTHTHDEEVAGHDGAVGELDLFDALGPPALLHPAAEVPLHAMLGVDIPVEGTELEPEHALEGQLSDFDHGDIRTELAGRRRHLAADPSTTDDDDTAGGAYGRL